MVLCEHEMDIDPISAHPVSIFLIFCAPVFCSPVRRCNHGGSPSCTDNSDCTALSRVNQRNGKWILKLKVHQGAVTRVHLLVIKDLTFSFISCIHSRRLRLEWKFRVNVYSCVASLFAFGTTSLRLNVPHIKGSPREIWLPILPGDWIHVRVLLWARSRLVSVRKMKSFPPVFY